MTNWFISINGDQKGPYPTDQLRQLVSDGFLSRDAYVWREGMANWLPLSQVRVSDDPVGNDTVPQAGGYGERSGAGQGQEISTDGFQQGSTYVKPGYFSFHGRISRQTYWLSYVLLPIIVIALASIPFEIVGKDFHVQIDELNATPILASLGFLLLVSLLLVIAGLAGAVKRLHDRNRTGWFYFIAFIPLIGIIWLFIELGFLKGTTGPNDYGADPLG